MKKVSFKNGKGLTLRGYIYEPKSKNGIYETAIITLHGFPGSCESERVVKTAELLEKKGFLVLRFDFSGTNNSDGEFADKLMSNEVEDIKFSIDFLQNNFKFKKLILHGHSTGATDASLYAYRDNRIDKLVLSGCIDRLDTSVHLDFTDLQVKDFWTKGYVTYKKRPGVKKSWLHNKKLNKSFYDEFFKLDIQSAIKKYKKQLLVIHGSRDEDVPIKKAIALYNFANKPKKLVILKGADHKFAKKKWLNEFVKEVDKFAKNKN
jgi:alpha/beta superfamily hydrolase